MTKLRLQLLAASALLLPLAAQAQQITGPYVSLGGGVNFMQNSTKLFGFAPPIDVGAVHYPVKLDTGYAASAAVGYGVGAGFRLELEGAYRSNPLKELDATTKFTYHGDEKNLSAMANIVYDADFGLPVFPYIGAGAGVVWNTESNVRATAGGLNVGAPVLYNAVDISNGTTAQFAYQVIAGASYPIAAVPGLSVTLDYKFFAEPNHRDFNRSLSLTPSSGSYPAFSGAGYAAFAGQTAHSVMVGLRYAFGAPAAAPVAPAAPAPAVMVPAPAARTYMVFFDWDRADLSARARQIVADAASASKQVATTTLEVNGYTDTTGTPKYNEGLSLRRAKAVAAELVRDGVPAKEIAIQGFGETHLLVPTAAGVREPQNRRVEIILK